jgi:hypothetical protein
MKPLTSQANYGCERYGAFDSLEVVIMRRVWGGRCYVGPRHIAIGRCSPPTKFSTTAALYLYTRRVSV